MTILELNLNDIESIVGRQFSVEEMEDILFSYGMELEDHEGDELRIDITPDRPDMLSKYGLCRALKKYLELERQSDYFIKSSGVEISVDNNLKGIRPYICAAVVRELEIDDEVIKDIIWTQEKLHSTFCRNRSKSAIGIYPFHRIKPPIRYYAERPCKIRFKPLGYDFEMTGEEILKEHETGQKFAFLLEGKEKFPLLMDRENNVLSMPPIINSEDTGKVDTDTRDLFIEVTGTNLTATNQVIDILTAMFSDMGGKLSSALVKYDDKNLITPNITPSKRKLQIRSIKDLLGIDLKKYEIVRLLERMGYGISNLNGEHITVLVPYYRTDVLHACDIIDDIARAYGFNDMIPDLPTVDTNGSTLKDTRISNFLRDLLVGLGFDEVFTLALANKETQYMNMNIGSTNAIELMNSKTWEMSIVRTWLLPELIRCLKSNEQYSLPVKLFEISDVCEQDEDSDTGYRNTKKLAALITDTEVTFTNIKQVLDLIMRSLNTHYELDHTNHSSFIEGRAGEILVDGKHIGILGELHPVVLKNWGWRNPIACTELNLDSLLQ
jgi:phenylalanyl-tRNA synthetase beta chain